MKRLRWFAAALLVGLLLAVWSARTPTPVQSTAPATAFAAGRALADVSAIARTPHPVGSADHARVRAWLAGRMTQLGLSPQVQTGPLSPEAVRRLERWGMNPDPALQVHNLVGILPGSDPTLPAVLLSAHYDSVPASPGAADDGAGVAAVLEAVRAIRARGPVRRDIVVLFTDAEELNLDGARTFFGAHPLRDRIGFVINLEARGGGGRAMMFETGPGNAHTVAAFAGAAGRNWGGLTSNSLAVLVYEMMPNGSDFTIPRSRGIAGVNLAFIGRADQYHTARSTPHALDPGSLQHIGGQALETADALARTATLPRPGADLVYADVFGRSIIGHGPALGWLWVGLAGFLALLAGLIARTQAGLTAAEIGRGMLDTVWFLATGIVLTGFVRALGQPLGGSLSAADTYYTLLARLSWIEVGVGLTVLSLLLALIAGRARPDRRIATGGVVVLTAVSLVLGGFNVVVFGAALVAVALCWAPGLAARSVWGGWMGAIATVLGLGLITQILAPTAAFLFLWPVLAASAVAMLVALLDCDIARRRTLTFITLVAALGVGWLMSLAHPVFLGVGMDLPGAVVLLALIGLVFIRPLQPDPGAGRRVAMLAAVALLLGAGVAAWSQIAEPAPVASRS